MLNEKEKNTFIAFCETDLNVAATARVTKKHRNTIEFRLNSIEKKTGLNPRHFQDAVKLSEMLQNKEL